jgi:hypothetical protein
LSSASNGTLLPRGVVIFCHTYFANLLSSGLINTAKQAGIISGLVVAIINFSQFSKVKFR